MINVIKPPDNIIRIYNTNTASSDGTLYAILANKSKLKVRDYYLEKLKNNNFIQDNFNLNIVRLNRWWYSVYFDPKFVQNNVLIENKKGKENG